jgi:cytochrome c biogenesis protein CcdA/glutaredoxin
MKRPAGCIIIAAMTFLAFAHGQTLQVLQTNANNGYLYPCKCPSEPKGGLAKRYSLIKQITANRDQLAGDHRDFLLFDSGDIWGLDSDRKTDSLVLAAYQAMGYQAVALGDQELSRGVDYFLELSGKFKLSFISANLKYRGLDIVPGFRIIKTSRAKAAVIGLLSPQAFKYYPAEVSRDLEILDPETVLRSLIAELKPQADMLILLSHLGYEKEQEMATKFPELDLIIGGHTQNELAEADRSHGVPIIEAGSKAARLTQAVMERRDSRWRLKSSKLWGVNSDLADHPAITSIVGVYIPRGQASVRVQGYGTTAVDVYYAPECPDCEKLKEGLFTALVREHPGRLKIVYRSVEDPLEYRRLLDIESQLGDHNNQIPAVVIGDRILGGVDEIEKHLRAEVAKATAEKPKSLKMKAPDGGAENIDQALDTARVDSIYLAFVSDLRCPKCGRAEYMLKALQAGHPNLAVRRYLISDNQGRLMAEALGLCYGVPEDKRLAAPLAYVGDQWLAGEKVNDVELGVLLDKYKSGAGQAPWLRAQPFLEQARGGLLSRFRSFGLWGVMAAGFLDGINPCALAVLVFFISYLAFVGRRRWEILAVGLSYTLADFIVYFLIGAGALSFLMTLGALPAISRALYWLALAVSLGLAFFSFRDFLKARRGDLSGMDLQLSDKTKQRIHRVIRERMSAGSLVAGAFVAGLLTSVLEFACTGQVYLPTIAFVSQIAGEKSRAYGLLLLYNLAFEVPMIAVFLIAFWGVSSKRIAHWAKASTAGVKLATAFLFLAMSFGLLILLLG